VHQRLVRFFATIQALDTRLLGVPRSAQIVAIACTFVVIALTGLRHVPRVYADFRSVPLLERVPQPQTYGTDTIADMYEARVVLNDVSDMYTKRLVEQTPLEAATWSKDASAPYPPATLLVEAGLYALGERTGIGFYGFIAALAVIFLAASAYYAFHTRWYIFPALYLNFSYLGERFFYVQDGSYLIMLTAVMSALLLARRRHPLTHALMALAVALKISPLYYLKNVVTMSRGMAALVLAIVTAGLILPVFIWEHYSYIFAFHEGTKGGTSEAIAAVLIAIPFALVLWYVETRLGFDMEDRVGWGLVPVALFLGLKMNAARHLVLVLLVPDKRGIRNVAASTGLAVPALLHGVVPVNSALLISTAVLVIGLAYYLSAIGGDVIRADARRPWRTLMTMLRPMSVAGR
jgi:hypothetical protein